MFSRKNAVKFQNDSSAAGADLQHASPARSPAPRPPTIPSHQRAASLETVTPHIRSTTASPLPAPSRGGTQETFISDLSSYDPEAHYVPTLRRDSSDDYDDDSLDDEKGGYPGPETWGDVGEGEIGEEASRLVRVFMKTSEEEDALLRQMAATAAALDENPRDPLGMGSIDPHTLKLMSKQGSAPMLTTLPSRKFLSKPTMSRSNSKSVRQMKVQQTEKVLPSSAAFSPEHYLATVHENTALKDLDEGMRTLETGLSKRTGQLKQLVKENFERFISCKNTIDDVYVRLHKNEADKRGVNTHSLRASITQVQEDAQRAFAPMVERNQKVQQIKSVIGVIKRFQSAFGLPARIRQLAESEDYPQVVSEYKRAKAMMAESEVSTWNRLFAEVEKGVSEVCANVIEGLENPDLEPEVVEEFVTVVLQLQSEGLPSAHGIQPIELWLASLEHHVHDEMAVTTKEHLANLTSISQRRRRARGSANRGPFGKELDGKASETRAIHECWVEYVSKLTTIILKYVPLAWTIRNSTPLKEVPDLTPATEEGIALSLQGADRICQGILEAFKSKVMESIDTLLHGQGLLPDALQSVLTSLRTTACHQIEDGGHPVLISTIQSILKDCHQICSKHLCGYLRRQMDSLSGWEDWVVRLGSRNSGIAVTWVPYKLGCAVREVMDQYRALNAEREEYPQTPRGISRDALQASFYECFELFAAAVEGQAASAMKKEEVASKRKTTPPKDASPISNLPKLLILIGNCRHIRKQLLSELTSAYADLIAYDDPFISAPEKPEAASLEVTFVDLEDRLLVAYIDAVKSKLNRLMDTCFKEEKEHPPKPSDLVAVSNGPIEWIHFIIERQAEIYEFAPCKQHAIMDPIILHLVSKLQSRTQALPHLGYHIQMYFDTSFLEAGLRKFNSKSLDGAWDSTYELYISRIMTCMESETSDLDAFGQKLSVEGGPVEMDKQLQGMCRSVLKDCMQGMGLNVMCLGVTTV
ncbi:hypothetical protein BSKO_10351 [Bryopsis sp. KO-2023]|nr:hypothetical protein BSKO_10351 [Bryopsis sp. KO-2023]